MRRAGIFVSSLALLLLFGCGKEGAGEKKPSTPIDTAHFPGKTGVLSMTGTGVVLRKFAFENVYASVTEQPIAGVTRKTLTVEAHNGQTDTHFKLRFMRDDGPIEVGSYSIDHPTGEPPMKLDATFEYGGGMYKAIDKAIGLADIKELDDAHISGTFSVRLESLSDPTKSETLIGTYNALVQH
jgi:hypothetical protein